MSQHLALIESWHTTTYPCRSNLDVKSHDDQNAVADGSNLDVNDSNSNSFERSILTDTIRNIIGIFK